MFSCFLSKKNFKDISLNWKKEQMKKHVRKPAVTNTQMTDRTEELVKITEYRQYRTDALIAMKKI